MTDAPAALFRAHLAAVRDRTDRALAATGLDALVIASGVPAMQFLDDRPYPFAVNPQFALWVPVGEPGCHVIYRPGQRPKLVFHQPVDYWHAPPSPPSGDWTAEFELVVTADADTWRQHLPRGRTALVAELPADAAPAGTLLNPQALLDRLDYERAAKTPHELACLRRASHKGVVAHRAAERAFRAGASEYEIHLEYCRAAVAREQELPYNNIVALNANGAVLHYQNLERSPPSTVRSFLIDAGATDTGYACDITRTYSAADDEFAALVRAMDALQQRLCAQVRPGVDYRDIHLAAHREIATVLFDFGLVRGSAEAAVATGVTSVFFPHGVGHLLGLQVHDVGGFLAGPEGGTRPRPDGHPYLRLTRVLEPGFVVTIEPGLYFIDQLLAAARVDGRANAIDERRFAGFAPYGGIRIEDDVAARADGPPENLTRDAFSALDSGSEV